MRQTKTREERIDAILGHTESLEDLKKFKPNSFCKDCKKHYQIIRSAPYVIVMTDDGEKAPRFSGSGDANCLKKFLGRYYPEYDFEDGYYYGGIFQKDVIKTSKEYRKAFQKEIKRINQNACKCSYPIM
jgi:hypothetical protein|tara:strand:+ start:126 stop:512 length:387 start_codon:yes stop_codon:yes gene_type:complete